MWIARDKDGTLRLWLLLPARGMARWNDPFGSNRDHISIPIDHTLFPEVTWESERLEVELSPVKPTAEDTKFHCIRCDKCGKAFTYVDEDIKTEPYSIDGYVQCPQCRFEVYL